MNAATATAQAVIIDGVTYAHTGTDEGTPRFVNEKGQEFVGMRNHTKADTFHMCPLTRCGKIRGQFKWAA